MSRIAISLCCLALFSVGCRNDDGQQAYYQQGSHMKPVVAIVPLIDSSQSAVSWNLSDELTSTIHHRLSQKEKLYLVDMQKVRSSIKKLNGNHNPFSTNLAWVKKTFSDDEFVVFLELIEHEEVPVYNQKTASAADSPAQLNMSVRVRILDLRGKEPEVVLQEMIHDNHYIPKQFTQANFFQVPWGKDSFSVSPIGLAHAQLTKEIAGRLEDYILLAKSK